MPRSRRRRPRRASQTIDYDRLTLGGSADYYVSFNNTTVGELQGKGLAECLGAGDKKIVYVNGSPDRQQRHRCSRPVRTRSSTR